MFRYLLYKKLSLIRIKIFEIKFGKIEDIQNYNTLSFKHYSTAILTQVILYNYVKNILNKFKSFLR